MDVMHTPTLAKNDTLGQKSVNCVGNHDLGTAFHTNDHFMLHVPVGYFDMLYLESHCDAVLTDSGGVQKEAFFFQKQCITLRDETEWVELVKHGYNCLAGANEEKILSAEARLRGGAMEFKHELYGDGHAGNKILEFLMDK